jgi:putative ATP-dependent endonuclease of OLD family
MNRELDHLGISICSVAGTNFVPYAKFLTGLGIPFSVVTDWDPQADGESLGKRRVAEIIRATEIVRAGSVSAELEATLAAEDAAFRDTAAGYGCFLNDHTLEIDLFLDSFDEQITETLLEGDFGPVRQQRIREWGEEPWTLDTTNYIALVNEIGKGRFAQRLASRISGRMPPRYIMNAIQYVVDRV